MTTPCRSPSPPWLLPTRPRSALAGRGVLALLLCSALLGGCGGGTPAEGGEDGSSPPTGGTQPVNADARLLASNCFQCHGTGGSGGFEAIRGGEADELREYRDLARRPASSDIMAAHAQGYTDAQISLILSYLKQ